jgi:predicted transcriptional regulator
MAKTKKRMQIEAQRSLLIKEIKKIEHTSLLKMLRTIIHDLIDIEQYNREYEETMKRMDAGQFVTHEEALKRLSKWKSTESRMEQRSVKRP